MTPGCCREVGPKMPQMLLENSRTCVGGHKLSPPRDPDLDSLDVQPGLHPSNDEFDGTTHRPVSLEVADEAIAEALLLIVLDDRLTLLELVHGTPTARRASLLDQLNIAL